MQLAYIQPKVYLPLTSNKSQIDLLLAHNFILNFKEIREDKTKEIRLDKTYTKLWREHNSYKILDNSAFEFGEALCIEKLVEVALAINADEIVLPDVLFDSDATLQKVKEAIEYLKNKGLLTRFNLMAVAHGKTPETWTNCYIELTKLPIQVIGASKATQGFHKNARNGFIRDLARKGIIDNTKELHFLGLIEDISEIFNTPYFVRSLDTSAIWMLAKKDITLKIDTKRPKETIDFEEVFDLNAWNKFRYSYIVFDAALEGYNQYNKTLTKLYSEFIQSVIVITEKISVEESSYKETSNENI